MPTLKELCELVGGDLKGPPELEITGVGSLEGAGAGDLAPVESEQYLDAARASKAAAFLAKKGLDLERDRPCILHDFPLASLNRVVERLGLAVAPPPPGIHPTAMIDPAARIGEDVAVGPHAIVGPDAQVGARSVLGPRVVLERGVRVGEDCLLEVGAVLHEGAEVGNRVRIGAYAVLSRQGFGFARGPKGPEMLHHVGKVVIEDHVHIGACTMIDRARFDETRIGAMSGLDNLVHIAHNCTIGTRTYIAAQTGLAGNGRIGDDCEVGGQVGIANHSGVGNRCRVAAKTGVMKLWGDDKELMWYPGRERKEILRILARLTKLAR